jgi:hypothetical protein
LRIVAEVVTPFRRCIADMSTPNFCRVARTKSAFSSSPTAPTERLFSPSFAVSTTVPPAVPATVRRISSMNSTLPPSGIARTGRPSTSRMYNPMTETS